MTRAKRERLVKRATRETSVLLASRVTLAKRESPGKRATPDRKEKLGHRVRLALKEKSDPAVRGRKGRRGPRATRGILVLKVPESVARARKDLLARKVKRVPPGAKAKRDRKEIEDVGAEEAVADAMERMPSAASASTFAALKMTSATTEAKCLPKSH